MIYRVIMELVAIIPTYDGHPNDKAIRPIMSPQTWAPANPTLMTCESTIMRLRILGDNRIR